MPIHKQTPPLSVSAVGAAPGEPVPEQMRPQPQQPKITNARNYSYSTACPPSSLRAERTGYGGEAAKRLHRRMHVVIPSAPNDCARKSPPDPAGKKGSDKIGESRGKSKSGACGEDTATGPTVRGTLPSPKAGISGTSCNTCRGPIARRLQPFRHRDADTGRAAADILLRAIQICIGGKRPSL